MKAIIILLRKTITSAYLKSKALTAAFFETGAISVLLGRTLVVNLFSFEFFQVLKLCNEFT